MDEAERRDLVGRLFADLTAKFEDAATLAAEGQGPRLPVEHLRSIAAAIAEHMAEARELSNQVTELLGQL
jgi:hypothetical protein